MGDRCGSHCEPIDHHRIYGTMDAHIGRTSPAITRRQDRLATHTQWSVYDKVCICSAHGKRKHRGSVHLGHASKQNMDSCTTATAGVAGRLLLSAVCSKLRDGLTFVQEMLLL